MQRVIRAILTNQIARWMPGVYVWLTGQTGRGNRAEENIRSIADYFIECKQDFLQRTEGVVVPSFTQMAGKTILEYGPGDFPGVALLMIAMGAEKVYCVDHFPMLSLSPRNVAVARLMAESLSGVERERLHSCFKIPGDFNSGFAKERIEYLVRPNGISGLEGQVDFVLSRAVMEHVANLEGIFADMVRALKPGAWMVHQVDLRNHGLYPDSPLAFLTPSEKLWNLMFSNKGVPNRWRINRYREVLSGLPLTVKLLQPTTQIPRHEVEKVRHKLASPFAMLPDEDLTWLGFWLIAQKDN